jgi:hypothetical protein
MVKAKTRARKQGTREGDRSMLTCRLAVGEGSGRFMTVITFSTVQEYVPSFCVLAVYSRSG